MNSLRVSMASLFTMLAATKLLYPNVELVGFPQVLMYAALAIELLVAALYWAGKLSAASVIGCVFFSGALVSAVVFPPEDCGCFGVLMQLHSTAVRVTVAATGGFLCAGTMWIVEQRARVGR